MKHENGTEVQELVERAEHLEELIEELLEEIEIEEYGKKNHRLPKAKRYVSVSTR